MSKDINHPKSTHDFGTFYGGHWPTEYQPLDNPVWPDTIMNWDECDQGEAVFWPAGDRPEMGLLFDEDRPLKKEELTVLSHLFDLLGGDTTENFLRIRHAQRTFDAGLHELTMEMVTALVVHITVGDDAGKARRRMQAELQMRYRLDAEGDVLKSVTDSPDWRIEELSVGEKTALVVAPLGKAWSER
jgi:hypothetical protein